MGGREWPEKNLSVQDAVVAMEEVSLASGMTSAEAERKVAREVQMGVRAGQRTSSWQN